MNFLTVSHSVTNWAYLGQIPEYTSKRFILWVYLPIKPFSLTTLPKIFLGLLMKASFRFRYAQALILPLLIASNISQRSRNFPPCFAGSHKARMISFYKILLYIEPCAFAQGSRHHNNYRLIRRSVRVVRYVPTL